MPENKNYVQLQRSLGLYSALSLVISTYPFVPDITPRLGCLARIERAMTANCS